MLNKKLPWVGTILWETGIMGSLTPLSIAGGGETVRFPINR